MLDQNFNTRFQHEPCFIQYCLKIGIGDKMETVKRQKQLNFYLTEQEWKDVKRYRARQEDERSSSAMIRDMIREKIYETTDCFNR